MNPFRTFGGKQLAIAVVVSQTLALAPLAVQAADDSVRLAGQVVFSTKSASGGMSADQRAEAIQRNLDNALVASQDRTPSAVNIVYVKGVPVITLGGYQVVTVNASDAKDAGTTPAILAQRWADALRGSLKDQNSVGSYVSQLSGGYNSSAPAASQQTAYNPPPPQQNMGQPMGGGDQYQGGGQPQGPTGYDQFGRQTGAPPQGGGYSGGPGYGAPPQYGYAGANYAPQQGYAGGGGYPPQNGYAGGGGYPPQGGYAGGGGYPMQRGRVVYAPAGLVMPVSLRTSISTQAASPGDLIEAALTDNVNLGDTSIPPGTVLVGQVVAAKAGGFMTRAGMLEVKFNRMRTPDGAEVPISAHIVGGIGKYAMGNGDTIHGETWKNKVGQTALRGAVGAGTGAALGTAIGAIAGHGGRGAGRGAWSGTAIGGGLGVADALILRKGKDVTIHSGTSMQVQLDAPVSVAGGGGAPYNGGY